MAIDLATRLHHAATSACQNGVGIGSTAQCGAWNCAPCMARDLLPRIRLLEDLEKAALEWRQQSTLTDDNESHWPHLAAIRAALRSLEGL